MTFEISDELQQVKEHVAEFVRTVLLPYDGFMETPDQLPEEVRREIRRKVQEAGLDSFNMPRELGCMGLPILGQVLVEEELGKTTNGLWQLVWKPAIVLRACTPDQHEKYVVPYVRGERSGCYAITEEDAGSDPSGIKTVARWHDGMFEINGEKWFVTGADEAGFLIVLARTHAYPGKNGMTLFFVDEDTPGIRVVRHPRFMHNFPKGHLQIRFENCRVPAEQVLGAVGEGLELSKDWFREERLMIAARCVGAADRLLELGTEFAAQRVQFGKPIAEYQAIQWMLADSATELFAARLMTYKAAADWDAGKDLKEVHVKVSMAKLFASEMAGRVVDRVLQIFGGRGYMRENPVERFYRDLRIDRIWEGTSEIQRLVIARQLLKRGARRICA